jgi:hypothetical protein
MDEKDRFGEKLKERERAEEDLYFAKRDRELLEKLKQKQPEKAAAEPAPTLGRCPKCGAALAERNIDGVTVDQCGSCGGVWLDAGELETLAGREKEGWLARLFRR